MTVQWTLMLESVVANKTLDGFFYLLIVQKITLKFSFQRKIILTVLTSFDSTFCIRLGGEGIKYKKTLKQVNNV